MPCRVLVATLPALLLSCGGGVQAPTARGTLVVATGEDTSSLLSVVSTSAADGPILDATSLSLLDVSFDCGLEYAPSLASEWSFSEDGTVLSMTLRDDARWADGEPVTARDVAFTYALLAEPEVASPMGFAVAQLEPAGRPALVDDHHLEWRFTAAYDRATQLAHVGRIAILPAHVLGEVEPAALRAHALAEVPLSSGPWAVVTHARGERVVLEPNRAFAGPEDQVARLDRVVFRVIPDYGTQLLELQAGKVDVVQGVRGADVARLRQESPELRLRRRGWRNVDFVAWNLGHPILEDVRVRRALAMAVDVDDLIARLLTTEDGEALGRRAVGTIPPSLCGAHADDLAPIQRDLPGARTLLAEAGWADSDGDGVADRAGEKLELRLSVGAGNARRDDAAVLLQSQLADVGVALNIEKVDGAALYPRLVGRDFDAWLGGWAASLFIDPTNTWKCDEGKQASSYNFGGYCSKEADAIIARGMATPDPQAAAPIWRELQARVHEDQPYLFLYWMDEVVAVHERFEGTEVDELSALGHLHRWAVPPDQVRYPAPPPAE